MGPRDGEGQEGWKMLGTVRVYQGETYFLDLQPERGQRSYCLRLFFHGDHWALCLL